MFRTALVAVLFLLAVAAQAGEPKQYQKARLLDMGYQTQAITSYWNTATVNAYGNTATGYGSSAPITRRYKDFNFIVALDGILYQTEYSAKYLWSHKPQWIVGDEIEVRLDKDKMFLRKPDGNELKTSIVQRVRIQAPPVAQSPGNPGSHKP